MEVKNLIHKGNTLQGEFHVRNSDGCQELCSEQYLCGAVLFQIKVVTKVLKNTSLVFARFEKILDDDNEYSSQLTCNNVNMEISFCGGNICSLIASNIQNGSMLVLKISVHTDICLGNGSFESLYEDIELTDFELYGKDKCAVKMHKTLLMASSPVLRTMLSGTWKETNRRSVDVAGISQETLQHLKDYIYLNKLPTNSLEELLLLASHYEMHDLELKCTAKLLNTVTNENVIELAEFAARNKINNFLVAILKHIHKNQSVKLETIKAFKSIDDDGSKAISSSLSGEEVISLEQRGNTLQCEFCVERSSTTINQYILGAVLLQIKVINTKNFNYRDGYADVSLQILVNFDKLFEDDNLKYSCDLTCNDVHMKIIGSGKEWHLISSNIKKINISPSFSWAFKIKLQMDIYLDNRPFAALYEDTELTDFELYGEEKSAAKMHKTILMSSSPVLRTMLSGTWKETTRGSVDVAGTSQATLQQLKDYIYLNKLAETGWNELLKLACYYQITDLEFICAFKILTTLNNENAIELLELAVSIGAKYLFLAILKHIKHNQIIQLENIAKTSKCVEDCKATGSL